MIILTLNQLDFSYRHIDNYIMAKFLRQGLKNFAQGEFLKIDIILILYSLQIEALRVSRKGSLWPLALKKKISHGLS